MVNNDVLIPWRRESLYYIGDQWVWQWWISFNVDGSLRSVSECQNISSREIWNKWTVAAFSITEVCRKDMCTHFPVFSQVEDEPDEPYKTIWTVVTPIKTVVQNYQKSCESRQMTSTLLSFKELPQFHGLVTCRNADPTPALFKRLAVLSLPWCLAGNRKTNTYMQPCINTRLHAF